MTQSKQQLLGDLTAKGLAFKNFQMVTEGEYSPTDAMWNYVDVAHLPHIHGDLDSNPLLLNDTHYHGILIQKFLGIPFPIIAGSYLEEKNIQIHYSTIFCFALIVESLCESVQERRTKVTTTYHLGAPRIFRFLLPLASYLIRKNYRTLLKEDIPLRTRRGELRGWGYKFRSDTTELSYKRSLDLSATNVTFPETREGAISASFDPEREFAVHEELLIGREDHLGMRVIRNDSQLMFFPRMCCHEGASLDRAELKKCKLQCAWHGKLVPPWARINLGLREEQRAHTPFHEIKYFDGVVSVQSKRQTEGTR